MPDEAAELRKLVIQWNPTLIVLSWVVSFLGTYAASQVCCQSSLCVKGGAAYHGWNILAAILFGLCAVWSLHFLAMLGAVFPVKVSLSPSVTVFSAVLAVVFTYLALVSDTYTSRYLRRRHRKARRKAAAQAKKEALAKAGQNGDAPADTLEDVLSPTDMQETEAEPLLPRTTVDGRPAPPESEAEGPLTDMKRALNDTCKLRALALDDERLERLTWSSTGGASSHTHSTPLPRPGPADLSEPVTIRDSTPSQPSSKSTPSPGLTEGGRFRRPSLSFFSRKWSSGLKSVRSSANASSTDLTGSETDMERRISHDGSTTVTSSGAGSFMRGLPLSKRERLRLKSGIDRNTTIKELLLTLWGDCTIEAIAKAGIWAMAIVTMHYSGHAAVHVDQGFAVWNKLLVLASAIIAWIVCLLGLLFMPNMEVNIARQLAFSFLAASGVFCMHFTGVSAATWYSSAPDTDQPGYPAALSMLIIAFVIFTCLMSTTMVSHAATLSRNKLVEMVAVKQQLWRTLAQKEAVEATVALQTEFTSVAAHELRTPLYTITGYIDLLARTQMDEEQALYVETVRRACHTIQLITTNVLDFTRLERANDETQARPVLVNIRKFVADLSEIIEDRGPRLDSQDGGLELIVDLADNLPEAIFLDETFLTRVLMNLCNNSSKFTKQGFITIQGQSDGPHITLSVADSGIGIPQRFQERIFEPFRQADTSLTRLNNGSGLGLAICKRLVARLDGELSVQSTEGLGSTFSVKLANVQGSGSYEAPAPGAERPSMAVFASNQRVQEKMSSLWTQRGLDVKALEATDPRLREVDFIWADLPTIVQIQPALLTFIKNAPAERSASFPYVCVVYSAETELLAIPASPWVLPLKRPINIGAIAHLLHRPKVELPTMAGQDKPKLVRFASMHSSAASEDSEERPVTPKRPVSPPPSAASEALELADTDGKQTILLVEDNPINAKLGQRMLVTLGYHVLVAHNGLEALETAKMAHDSIACVLMDCEMPVMGGTESTSLIRKHEADNNMRPLTILALSANVNTQNSNTILDAGADGFLAKPISMKGLGEALTRYMVS